MADRRHFLKAAVMAMPGLAVSGRADPASHVHSPWPVQLDDWEKIRGLYDLWDARTYLNTGGLGPSPRPVLDRFREVMDDLQLRSEAGHNLIEAAREPVARFFG
ncbi:MAG: hypothetical protein ACO37D_06285, partial [Rhodothermales bacterium]